MSRGVASGSTCSCGFESGDQTISHGLPTQCAYATREVTDPGMQMVNGPRQIERCNPERLPHAPNTVNDLLVSSPRVDQQSTRQVERDRVRQKLIQVDIRHSGVVDPLVFGIPDECALAPLPPGQVRL